MVATESPGSASVIAKIAGIADSSPMNRCQSAPGDVVIFPRGPMPSIRSPGCAAVTHLSPGPVAVQHHLQAQPPSRGSSARIV